MTVTEMTVTVGPRCGQDHMIRSYDPVISVTVMPTLVRRQVVRVLIRVRKQERLYLCSSISSEETLLFCGCEVNH